MITILAFFGAVALAGGLYNIITPHRPRMTRCPACNHEFDRTTNLR